MLLYLMLVYGLGIQGQHSSDALSQNGCKKYKIEDRCPNKNVTFWLFNDQVEDYKLDDFNVTTIEKAPFNNGPVKILIHGFSGHKNHDPNRQLRPEYLKLGYNVISIDYGYVARIPCYIQSVANADTVANCFARFISLLLNTTIENRAEKFISIDDIHVIGFSLGGQISGDAGHKLQKVYHVKLPRVTALDPALPLYYGKLSRVDRKSAKFVDCLHTNAGVFGKILPVATADFYFNYIVFQRGCIPTNTICNHVRGPQYFAESIIPKDKKFCGGNGSFKVEVGEYVKNFTRGRFYVTTNRKSPFAKDDSDAC